MPKAFRTTREITRDECPWLPEAIPTGELVYQFNKATYGIVNWATGIAVSAVPDEYPFNEVPRSALQEVTA